jgi:hypothetical protein
MTASSLRPSDKSVAHHVAEHEFDSIANHINQPFTRRWSGRCATGDGFARDEEVKDINMMNKMIFAVAAVAGIVASPTFAQAPGGGQRGSWGQHDQTRQEAQQRADMIFQMIDSNRDGVLTRAEAEQAAQQFAVRSNGEGRGGGRMQRMIDDAFGSASSLTLQQFEAQALARFDAADLNHDGVVTAAEREQMRAQGAAGVQAPVAPSPTAVPPPRQ